MAIVAQRGLVTNQTPLCLHTSAVVGSKYVKDLVVGMMGRTLHRLVKHLALGIALLVGLASAMGAHAEGSAVKLGIKPVGVTGSYFMLTMVPGETHGYTVELGNFGAETVNARTYAADAYTIVNGGFGAKLDGEPTSGTTHWLDYTADTIALASGTGINRTFQVSVPADTTPGEYITSLVIQNADIGSTTTTGSVGIRQVTRQVIAVVITVPGPRAPSLEIGAATYRTVAGNSAIAIAVKNTGNVRLKPAGEFILRDASGIEVSRYPIMMDSVYAGTETFVEVPFTGRLNPGAYTAALALADSTQGVSAAAHPSSLTVPQVESEGAIQPIGTAPQPAAISQAAPAAAGLDLRSVLIGGSLMLALALFGLYGYRRYRQTHGPTAS